MLAKIGVKKNIDWANELFYSVIKKMNANDYAETLVKQTFIS